MSATASDIYGRLVGGGGQPAIALIAIDADPARHGYPAVACNTLDDEFLVVYERNISTTCREIEAQRIRASNGSLASWRNIARAAFSLYRLPDVAYNPARNEYLIAYTREHTSVGRDIIGRLSSASMGWLGDEFYIVPDGDSVALAGGYDEYLAVWEEDKVTNANSIRGRQIHSDGGLEPYIDIAHETGHYRVEPAAAFGDGGHYLVTWRHVAGAHPFWGVNGRMLNPSSNTPEGPEFPIDASVNAQKVPAVACAPSGPCLVVYEDEWPGPSYDIRGRLVGHTRGFLPLLKR